MSNSTPSSPNEQDVVHRDDEEWKEISKQWLNTHRQLETLEQDEKKLRETLIQMAGAQNTSGGGIRLTRSLRNGNVQYTQIPELKDVDLEKYRKEPTEVWRLVIDKKEKINPC
jgi:hypothetical protein